MKIEEMNLDALIPYERNAKIHDDRQIENVAKSIEQFGMIQPIVIDKDRNIIIGHCRTLACKKLGIKTVPVVKLETLTPEEANRLRFLDNKLNESEWDLDMLQLDEIDLTGFNLDLDFSGMGGVTPDWFSSREKYDTSYQEGNEEYNEFLDKFEIQKTTDDCYTPDNIYNAVADWVADEYNLDKSNFVRPFYPGGDYEREQYRENDVVVDNPPFSILSQIIRYYSENGIGFFLFGPSLTLCTATDCDVTYIAAGCQVTYENGANVSTGFITNLDKENRFRTAPSLWEKVKAANDENLRVLHKELPNYSYPDNVVVPAVAMKWSHYGEDFRVKKEDCIIITELDEQKAKGKAIFGKGFLLSEKAAAEKWELSDREWEIVKELGK